MLKAPAALAVLSSALLAGCVQTASTGGVSRDAITDATNVAEFEALGATRLDEAAFRSRIVERSLVEAGGSWTWTIRADGTNPSRATDGSWEADNAWSFRNGQFCRGDVGCSDVYAVGDFFRMTEVDPPSRTRLDGWTVTYR